MNADPPELADFSDRATVVRSTSGPKTFGRTNVKHWRLAWDAVNAYPEATSARPDDADRMA